MAEWVVALISERRYLDFTIGWNKLVFEKSSDATHFSVPF